MFNANELGLKYRLGRTRTVGPASLKGKNKNKVRVTIPACTNSDGTERLAQLVVGSLARPRCFGGRDGNGFDLDYVATRKAWMTQTVFCVVTSTQLFYFNYSSPFYFIDY